MIKLEPMENADAVENHQKNINSSTKCDSVIIKCEKATNCTKFNILQSSEISKVLRELTKCVASEHDLFVPENIDVPRSDLSCSEFSGSTTTNSNLELLCRPDNGAVDHICGDCGKQFSKRDFLQKHRIVHEEPRHRCVICEKSFVREDKLKRHFVSIHSKHRPHVCTICAKSFARKDKLKDHQKHHLTACNSFMCLDCRIPFVQKSDLNRHTRSNHSCSSVNNQNREDKVVSIVKDEPVLPTSVSIVTSVITQKTKTRSRRMTKPFPRRSQSSDTLIASASCPTVSSFLTPAVYDNPLHMYSSPDCPHPLLSTLLHPPSSLSSSNSNDSPSNYPLKGPMISAVFSLSSDDKYNPLKTSLYQNNHHNTTGGMLLAAATHHNLCQFQQQAQLRYYHSHLHHQLPQSQQSSPFNGHSQIYTHHNHYQQQQQLTANMYPNMPF